jgi:hypothetical protein
MLCLALLTAVGYALPLWHALTVYQSVVLTTGCVTGISSFAMLRFSRTIKGTPQQRQTAVWQVPGHGLEAELQTARNYFLN